MDFLGEADGQEAAIGAAGGQFSGEWRRWGFKGGHFEGLGDGGARPGSQLRREFDLHAPS